MSDDTFQYIEPENIEVGSLLDQLKGNNVKALPKEPYKNLFPLTSETMEEFILKSSEILVNNSLETINQLKDGVGYTGDPKDIQAISGLISSTNAAIDTISKLHQTKLKVKSNEILKQIEIKSKEKEGEKNRETYLNANREEVLKLIQSPTFEAEIVEELREEEEFEKTQN